LLKLATDVLWLYVQDLSKKQHRTIEFCDAVNIVIVDVAFGKNCKACVEVLGVLLMALPVFFFSRPF